MDTEFWWGKLLENVHLEDQEDNIKMDIRKIGYENCKRMELAQDRIRQRVLAVLNLRNLLQQCLYATVLKKYCLLKV